MIDLHFHTVYSDGIFKEQDVLDRIQKCDAISITDHNTVYMYRSLLKNEMISANLDNLIIGVEITAEGYPDCLLYYPNIVSHTLQKIDTLESLLRLIRQKEQEAIKKAYEFLKANDDNVCYTDWEHDYIPYSVNGFEMEARTVDLACIRYRKRTKDSYGNVFKTEDLKQARIARRAIGCSCDKYCDPFYIAGRTEGEIVLAHPLHSAYNYAGRDTATLYDLKSKLMGMLSEYKNKGGKIVEWEYLDNNDRHKLLCDNMTELRNMLLKEIERLDLLVVWGTDSHYEFPADSSDWSLANKDIFVERIPIWLKQRL